MRVASKINLAVLSTLFFAVVLVMGNLYILNEQFEGLEQTEQVQSITRLSNTLLVLTQEYVLFKSPYVADTWLGTHEELQNIIQANAQTELGASELREIQQNLSGLKPLFSELLELDASQEGTAEFVARRENLIVERLISETQNISEMGYLWANRVNARQESSLRSLTVLGSIGLASFILVIGMLVVLMRTGVLNPIALLKRTADSIRNGNEDAVCPVDTPDELGDVSRAVNQMAHNLAHKNRRLREANARAERASKAKTEFLSSMSHEIRTPLNGIVGLTYLLKDTAVSANQQILLDSLEKTSRNLIDLVSDVLDIAKIESGSMELEVRTFSVLEFLDKVSGVMTGAAASKPIELIIQPSAGLPLHLVGDELRLRQVVVNLVGNAIKFTPMGHVLLKMDALPSRAGVCRLRIEVQDSGIGISPQGQDNLFKQFQQADSSVAREFGGSGLGLSLVKKLVDMMNGQLGFQSEPGRGSTFWAEIEFHLPAEPQHQRPILDEACTVLLVSDQVMQVEAIRQSAALVGRSLTVLPELRLARQWLEQGDALCGVILDFPKHPIDQGAWQDFIHVLNKTGVPCAVLAGSDDTRRLLDYDLNDLFGAIFVKPITPLQLEGAFCTPARQRPGPGPGKANSSEAIRLLIVDDSELNLKVLEGILARKRAEVTRASNGLEALALLMNPDHAFDAVVMDVQMPLMDGLEATRELRKLQFNTDLPVIGLTGEVSAEDHRLALEAGMNAVLHKPLQPAQLMQLLNTLVRPVPA